MVLDGRAEDKFEALQLYTNKIKGMVPKSFADYSKSAVIKDATERNLQLISDAELDLLAYLYKKVGKEAIISENSLPEKLAGVLNKEVLEGYKRRRELRNKLVHAYKIAALDKDIFEQASNLKDVEDFKRAVERAIG